MIKRKISDADVADPVELRRLLQGAYDRTYELLGQQRALALALKSRALANGGLTGREREILESLSIGSTENPVAAQRPVVPTYTDDPPASSSTDGELYRKESDGIIRIFSGDTQTWDVVGASAAAHNMLSATHGDSVTAAALRGALIVGNAAPAWTRFALGAANLVLRVNAGGTDPEWGAVPDAALSANVAMRNAANTLSALLTLSAGLAITAGPLNIDQTLIGFAASPYDVLSTDIHIIVNSSGGAITVRLPAAPTLERVVIVTDVTGNAAANNITVSGNGNNINGAATRVLNTNYASVTVTCTGSDWNVI